MTEPPQPTTPLPFPDRAAIKSLLAHRATLRRLPEELFTLGGDPVPEGDAATPLYAYSEDFQAFVQDLRALGFVARFDWPDWQDAADKLQREPDSLRNATLTDLVKLLTVHVERERFREGHWAVALQEGWFNEILTRLAAIDAELDVSPAAVELIENREQLSST